MSDWGARKSGGSRNAPKTKDVVAAARLARQQRQQAALELKAAKTIQSFVRTIGPRRMLGQGLFDIAQRRNVDIGRVCEMQLAHGISFIPPFPLILDLAFKLVLASRNMRKKNDVDVLMCSMLSFMEQAMRSSDLSKGLQSLLLTPGSQIVASSLAKVGSVTRCALWLSFAKTTRIEGKQTRAQALSYLAAMTRVTNADQGVSDRDIRRQILFNASSVRSLHHEIASAVLASLTDRHDDTAIALELLGGAVDLSGNLKCAEEVLCSSEWDMLKVFSVGPLLDRSLIQSGAHIGWPQPISGGTTVFRGFNWVASALDAHRNRPRDTRTMALLMIAQRVTLLRLAYATTNTSSSDSDVQIATADKERQGLAAVTLALAIRATSKDDYAKAIRFCDTVVSVSRDTIAHTSTTKIDASADEAETGDDKEDNKKLGSENGANDKLKSGPGGVAKAAESDASKAHLPASMLTLRADALLLRSRIFEHFNIWAQSTADAKQVMGMGSKGGVGLTKWRVARDRVKHLELMLKRHVRESSQQNIKQSKRDAALGRELENRFAREERSAVAATVAVSQAQKAIKKQLKSLARQELADLKAEEDTGMSDAERALAAKERQRRREEKRAHKKVLSERDQAAAQTRKVVEMARQQQLREEWDDLVAEEAEQVRQHAKQVLRMRQNLTAKHTEEAKRLAAAAVIARPFGEVKTFQPESGGAERNVVQNEQDSGASSNDNVTVNAAVDAARLFACSDEPMTSQAKELPPTAPRPRAGEWASIVAPTTTTAQSAAEAAAAVASLYGGNAMNTKWHIKGPINFWADPQELSSGDDDDDDDDDDDEEEEDGNQYDSEDEEEEEDLNSSDVDVDVDADVGGVDDGTFNSNVNIDSNTNVALPLPTASATASAATHSPRSTSTPTGNFASAKKKATKERPAQIVIDGANVGYFFGGQFSKSVSRKRNFGAQGLKAALDHFNGEDENEDDAEAHGVRKRKYNRAVVFLPQKFVQSRYASNLADDVGLVEQLIAKGQVMLTPSGIDDDLFILQYAAQYGCTVVSNDGYFDHLEKAQAGEFVKSKETNTKIEELITNRLKKYMFVGHEFIVWGI